MSTATSTATLVTLAAAGATAAAALKFIWSGPNRRRVGSALKREKCIYLDVAATCPIYPDVASAMLPYLFRHWGNPSSAHAYGEPCRRAVDKARSQIATMINAKEEEIIFCSCGSEADNWALVGAVENHLKENKRAAIVTSSIEHPAILKCCESLKKVTSRIVGCDALGFVAVQDVADAVVPGETAVVSIMLANNEVGSVQDLKAIVAAVKKKDPSIFVHTDAAQAVGKIPVDVQDLGVDALTLVGHKFGAPKGIAALYLRSDRSLPNFFHGGGQEHGRRAGTEAVPNIVALGEAAQVWIDQGPAIELWSTQMRDRLRTKLTENLLAGGLKPDLLHVNGPLGTSNSLPNVLSIAIDGVPASTVLADVKDLVAASASAACHSSSTAVSSVLLACGVPEDRARGTFRLSVGRHTTRRDVDTAASILSKAILKLT